MPLAVCNVCGSAAASPCSKAVLRRHSIQVHDMSQPSVLDTTWNGANDQPRPLQF